MKKLMALALAAYLTAVPLKVSSTDLIEKAAALDGKTVVYQGEAVGDILARGSYAWVNISDGDNAIGIYLTGEQAALIRNLGSYQKSGDVIEVTGTFNRACAQHGGDLDIHADSIRVVSPGHATPEDPDANALSWSVIAFIIACIFGYMVRRKAGML